MPFPVLRARGSTRHLATHAPVEATRPHGQAAILDYTANGKVQRAPGSQPLLSRITRLSKPC